MCVAHHGVQVDLLEGHLPGQLDAHHHHASHPEEQDVVPSLHHLCGVERLEVRGLCVGPAQCAEGPQTRGEPGVKYVLLLPQGHTLAVQPARLVQGLRLTARHHPLVTAALGGSCCLRLAAEHVPHGDAVTPPQLPADAPVLDVLQPVVVDLLKPVRDEADVALLHRLQGGGGQGGHAHKPLLAHQRLNDLTTALGAGNP
mmetsp:Transcript_29964/g.66341  ORF Transcript_29964/g.66341 Transcript_29964/m.66341 type:complete len:200 (-) Transcript_29964:1398-1997(-)